MEHIPAGPLKMSVRCVQELVTNRMIVQTRSRLNAQTVTEHILPPVKNAQHWLLRKELSNSKQRLAAHSLQPGSKLGRLLQQNRLQVHMQVLANNRADLVNRNLALSDENARLKEVINTLRQDNASLQQRLDGYEQRLQTLEKSMLGGTHADVAVSVPNTNTTSVGSAHNIGVHNTTSVESTHNTTPVGDAHNTTPVGEAHKLRLEGPHGLTDRAWRHSWPTC